MICSSRYITALILTVIYLLITMSPLAPLALKSPTVAHAVTGECSGDCDICGCSAERRANHTCCCWQKKLKQQHDHEHDHLPPCCRKKHRSGKPTLTSNCPCGSGKQIALWGAENNEQIPCQFTVGIPITFGNLLDGVYEHRLTDRYDTPPDPPPKHMELS